MSNRLAGAARRHTSRGVLATASDERLTEEMRHGNETAFEEAYARYAGGLLSLCRHILGSPEEAEEAVQHSLAAAWSDLQRRDRPAPETLKPWLYAIARHRCLSILRSRKPTTVPLDEVPSASGLAEHVVRRADLRALLADLQDLPEEQKTALVLSEIAGLSHADIADVLGRRESGIKALVFQARTTLGDWREAREARCEEMREQLSVLSGGALRRRPLRRHLQRCATCRAFRAELKAQRRGLAIILPVLPGFGLERGTVAAVGVGAGAGGGVTAGGGLSLTIPSLVPIGWLAAATVTVVGLGGGDESPAAAADREHARAPVTSRGAGHHEAPPTGWRSTALAPASSLADGPAPARGRVRSRRAGPRAAAIASAPAATPTAVALPTTKPKTLRSTKPRSARGTRRALAHVARAERKAMKNAHKAKRKKAKKGDRPPKATGEKKRQKGAGQPVAGVKPCRGCHSPSAP